MNSPRFAVAVVVAITSLGAAPAPPRYGPVPENAQTATVRKYVDALVAGRYDDAYALLIDRERRYFRDANSFRSVFEADGVAYERARIAGAIGDDRARVYLVRERLIFVDHATDAQREGDFAVPLGVVAEGGALRIKDPGKPYRAFASNSTVAASNLRVTVKKVDFYDDRIDIVVTLTNLGDTFVTVLPYDKSVLRDDRGNVYRIIATKNWTITDKQLFEGVPLAPNARYTGSLAFGTARRDLAQRAWSLTVAPALREGTDAPFELTVPIVPRS